LLLSISSKRESYLSPRYLLKTIFRLHQHRKKAPNKEAVLMLIQITKIVLEMKFQQPQIRQHHFHLQLKKSLLIHLRIKRLILSKVKSLKYQMTMNKRKTKKSIKTRRWIHLNHSHLMLLHAWLIILKKKKYAATASVLNAWNYIASALQLHESVKGVLVKVVLIDLSSKTWDKKREMQSLGETPALSIQKLNK